MKLVKDAHIGEIFGARSCDRDERFKMSLRIGISALVGLTLLGCASSSIQPLTQRTFAAKPENCKLFVYSDAAKVERKYFEIALITHKTPQDAFSDKGASAITSAMSAEACKLGADGIILKGMTQGSWGDPGNGSAVAFRFGE